VLYHEIASHARVVSSCIRAAEKEQQLQQQQQLSSQQPASLTSNCSSESTSESATKSSSLSSGFASDPVTTPIGTAAAAPPSSSTHPSKKGEGNLERLRDRYHLLYLKAFELQLCLDNLLRKRSSAAVSFQKLLNALILFHLSYIKNKTINISVNTLPFDT